MYAKKDVTFQLKSRLKGTVSRDFLLLVLFMNQFPPAPEYSIKTVSNFFENSRRYSQLKVCHRCQRHRWQMEKIFNQKNFNNFVCSPLSSRGNIYVYKFLTSSSLSGISSLILLPLFATGVNDTGGKFAAGAVDTGDNLPPAANLPPVSLTPMANLPPVATTQGELVAKFAAGVVDTGGKFAAAVIDIGGNFPPVANLPPVSLIPVVHLDLRISPRIFEKI